LWTKIKNQSGLNESGEILDKTERDRCKIGNRLLNIPLFYAYLLWKCRNLSFISNALPESVAMSTGTTAVGNKRSNEASSSSADANANTEGAQQQKKVRATKVEKIATATAQALGTALAPSLRNAFAGESTEEKQLEKAKIQSEITKNEASATYIKHKDERESMSAKVQRLESLMHSPAYGFFNEDQKEQVKTELFNLVMGNSAV